MSAAARSGSQICPGSLLAVGNNALGFLAPSSVRLLPVQFSAPRKSRVNQSTPVCVPTPRSSLSSFFLQSHRNSCVPSESLADIPMLGPYRMAVELVSSTRQPFPFAVVVARALLPASSWPCSCILRRFFATSHTVGARRRARVSAYSSSLQVSC